MDDPSSFILGCVLAMAVGLSLGFTIAHYRVMLTSTVEGKVIAVEKEVWPWKHTIITFAVYGDQTIRRTYESHLELEIETIYKITSRGSFFHAYPTIIDIQSSTGSANK